MCAPSLCRHRHELVGFGRSRILLKASRFFMPINLNWSAAILCYLPFVSGLLVFVIPPSLQTGSTKKALVLGALFGLITYAAYALTNMATVKDWPWVVTVADLVWGCLLATAVSYIGFLAGSWLRRTASAPTKSLATRRIYECCWTEG